MLRVCRVTRSRADVAERYVIRYCLDSGARLLNWNYNRSLRWPYRSRVSYGASPDPTGEWETFRGDYRDMFE